jgi:hypothetical protein
VSYLLRLTTKNGTVREILAVPGAPPPREATITMEIDQRPTRMRVTEIERMRIGVTVVAEET